MHLVDIRVYPVKALRGGSHREIGVEPWGLAGDRRWMVIDDAGRFVTQRTHPGMALIAATAIAGGIRIEAPGLPALDIAQPDANAETVDVTVWNDALPARLATPDAAALLTRATGEHCRLVWMHDPRARSTDPVHAPAGSTVNFADGFPVLLGSIASLDALNDWLDSPITIARFRPNLVISGAHAWEEDRWRRIRIGEVTFLVVKASDRCIVTTIDQDTGERPDKAEPLRALGRHRKDASGGVMFGQNLVPENVGSMRTGDEVEILETGSPNVSLETAA